MLRRRSIALVRPARDATVLEGLLRIAWRMPLYSVPFALFFGTLFGRGAGVSAYRDAYVVSLVFAYVIGLMLLGLDHLIVRRFLPAEGKRTVADSLRIGGLYSVTSILGVFVAALLMQQIIPGFSIGGPRGLATLGMFAVLFAALFGAAGSAYHFYQQAILKARAEEELNMARRIQRSFLRETFPEMPGWEVHAVNISSKQVSGDFYDVVSAGNGAVLLAIADVSGKGVPAALQSSLLQASLRTQALSERSVGDMLATINTLLHESTTPGQFATFVLARVDVAARRLVYSNAGHNHPVLVRAAGTTQPLDKGGVPLGIMDGVAFEEDALTLSSSDRVVFFTDGISEAANDANVMYGEERIEEFVRALPPELSAREIVDRLVSDVRRHLNGVEAGDDMTVLVLRAL